MIPTHNAWIQTYSGVALDLLEPTPEMFNINDIALGLSRVPRWGGQTVRFMSVAEHSLRVSENVHPALALLALLHDGSEAFTGDVPTPVKRLCHGFQKVENRLQTAIYNRFMQPQPLPLADALLEVAEADARTISTEYRDLHPHTLFTPDAPPYDWHITGCMDPANAELAFLERFHKLTEGRYV